mmetsp:Transcript_71838/g.161214  ORF Transcript_71838/g.161214 Transcript_71838/m.161214 type:complete len:257 (-) Transcript_71838:67-837(-)
MLAASRRAPRGVGAPGVSGGGGAWVHTSHDTGVGDGGGPAQEASSGSAVLPGAAAFAALAPPSHAACTPSKPGCDQQSPAQSCATTASQEEALRASGAGAAGASAAATAGASGSICRSLRAAIKAVSSSARAVAASAAARASFSRASAASALACHCRWPSRASSRRRSCASAASRSVPSRTLLASTASVSSRSRCCASARPAQAATPSAAEAEFSELGSFDSSTAAPALSPQLFGHSRSMYAEFLSHSPLDAQSSQ